MNNIQNPKTVIDNLLTLYVYSVLLKCTYVVLLSTVSLARPSWMICSSSSSSSVTGGEDKAASPPPSLLEGAFFHSHVLFSISSFPTDRQCKSSTRKTSLRVC